MNKFKTSAIEILKESNASLHYREITRLALEKGILETEGATPEASMNAQIVMDIKNKGKLSDFIKISPSTYALNPNRIEKVIIVEEEKSQEEKQEIESGYIGKGGEYLVCSELLFRGFNASIMSVDTGIDIVAVRESRLFSIQVKTARINKFNTYVFDVRKASFERHNSGNTYYIFVLYTESKPTYLILTNTEVERKVHEKAILEVGHRTRYRVNIKIRNENIYLGTLDHQMNYFLNNWNVIK